ncbi:hypothetical protein H6F67_10320 [Microcoleus sp. FACHB-1515]|uniref:hypothetical protein n=1 Tax=Cyanophyceae TaxID=3028117 RepID=UPI00168A2C71|nr:hypothetical protein [Microcoleus sp. FACHB-1515]MBD2090247.1 hypothetical protein [Microcoleus sp. FACHB-1515]
MTVIICPGIHPPELTASFVQQIGAYVDDYLIVPSDSYPYSAPHIFHYIYRQFVVPRPTSSQTVASTPLVFISFSAGVVGAIGAAWMWQALGKKVKAFIAFDGWGVPLIGNFPIHRISHDRFTHDSSIAWGGAESFYADPPVAHLDLWRSPQTAIGWRVQAQCHPPEADRTTAADFLLALLAQHHEIKPKAPILQPPTPNTQHP